MAEENMVGMPDPEAEYFARIQFGRAADPETGKEEKIYLDFQYPNLPYGAMVGIQKQLQETVLPDLVMQGELVAEMMGQPVQSVAELREALKALRAQRPQKGGGKPVR